LKLGAFVMPSHPPERPWLDGYRWDLDQLVRLDRLGFHEAWIGEHFTAPWEPNPAPDLLIAQALLRTQRIFYVGSGMGPQFLAHPSHAVEKLDVDYLIKNSWFVGSPATVTDKIGALQHATGGFGCLLIMLYDFSTEPDWWEESLVRLVEEVLPHLPD
jgi:alkanesulfonate monooxygenase SsuD/methylene tetrahydromethanopterin reductase-like flavin-dependent oxidoreductase (luciferase family)